jgi:pimeloyl-ACP methyl ester carboxylesterase
MKVKKGCLSSGRFEVPYRIYGDAPQVIVCVSGAQQTMAAWKSFVSHFMGAYTVVIYDAPGQGRAKVASGPHSVTVDEQVTILAEIVERTSPDRPVHIASASWGTIVGAAYAARATSAVGKLILGSFGIRPSATLLQVINQGQQLARDQRGAEIGDLMIDSFGNQLPEHYKDRVRAQFRSMSHDQILHFFAHSEFVEGVRGIDEVLHLPDIEAETLVVNGENDTILDPEDLDVARALIPRCVCRIFAGVGHFLHFENPDILKHYEDFLSSGLGEMELAA